MLQNEIKMKCKKTLSAFLIIFFCLLCPGFKAVDRHANIDITGKVNLPAGYGESELKLVLSYFSDGSSKPFKNINLNGTGSNFNFQDIPQGFYDLWVLYGGSKFDVPIFITDDTDNVRLSIELDNQADKLKLSSVVFVKSSHNQVFSVKNILEENITRYSDAVKKYKKEYNSLTGFDYAYTDLLENLESLLEGNEISHHYAAALLIKNSDHLKQIYSLAFSDSDRIPNLFKKALNIIPAESAFWKLEAPGNASLARMASGLVENQDAEKIFQAVYSKNKKPGVSESALLELTKLSFVNGDQKTFQKLYNELEAKRPTLSSFIRTEMFMMKPTGRVFIGSDVPEFKIELTNTIGEMTHKDLSGKYYLIDFWGTWCPPCIEEIPYLQEAHKRFSNRNFEILSIAYNDKQPKVEKFIQRWGMPWNHTVLESLNHEVVKQFGVWHAPSTFLISPDGKIIAAEFMLRGRALLNTLDRVLPK